MSKSSPPQEIRWCGNSQGSSAFGFSSYLFTTNNASVGSDTYICVSTNIYTRHLNRHSKASCSRAAAVPQSLISHKGGTAWSISGPTHLSAAPSTSPRLWMRACPCSPLLPCRSSASYQNQEVHTWRDLQWLSVWNTYLWILQGQFQNGLSHFPHFLLQREPVSTDKWGKSITSTQTGYIEPIQG